MWRYMRGVASTNVVITGCDVIYEYGFTLNWVLTIGVFDKTCYLCIRVTLWERCICTDIDYLFPIDCRQVRQKPKKSPVLVYLSSETCVSFPRLVYTWRSQTSGLCLWTIIRYVEWQNTRIVGTLSQWPGKYLPSVLGYRLLPNKPVVETCDSHLACFTV